MIWDKCCLG